MYLQFFLSVRNITSNIGQNLKLSKLLLKLFISITLSNQKVILSVKYDKIVFKVNLQGYNSHSTFVELLDKIHSS